MYEVRLTQTDFFHEIRIPGTNLILKKKFIFIFKKKTFMVRAIFYGA